MPNILFSFADDDWQLGERKIQIKAPQTNHQLELDKLNLLRGLVNSQSVETTQIPLSFW